MRLGPFTIERSRPQNAAIQAPRSSSMFGELGAPGQPIAGGMLSAQDYNPDLQFPNAYQVYDRMRLGDGQVRAVMSAIKLPILRAHWEIESASDTAQDQAIAEFCEEDLEAMTVSFISFMRQTLLMLDYGSMLFEKVWEIRADGMVHLRKLAPRLPATIVQWFADANGGFAGVKQNAQRGDGVKVVDIQAEKLLLFVNEQEGANFRGISLLRAAYKHWYFKDGLYRIDAIAKEKRSIGVDVGVIKAGAADKSELKANLERTLMTLHAHEKQFLVVDEENYDYRLETGGAARTADAMISIEHHDLRIARAMLAEFLAMGAGSTGSLAMHKDKSAFFLMTLEAIADAIAETINTYLLPQWCDYNYAGLTEYPRMKYSRLDTRNLIDLADAVAKLTSAGAFTHTLDTENEIRVVADLPQIDEADLPPPAAPAVPPAPMPGMPPAAEPDVAEAVVNAAEVWRRRQVDRLMTAAPGAFRAENPTDPATVGVPHRQPMAEDLAPIMGSMAAARGMADAIAAQLRAAYMAELAEQIEAGEPDAPALRGALEDPRWRAVVRAWLGATAAAA